MILKAYPPRMSPEQFDDLPDSRDFELVDGILTEKQMGTESGSVMSRVNYYLGAVVVPNRLGELIVNDGRFRCFPRHPNSVRKPDVAFILQHRLPDGRVPIGTTDVRPDLVVEVVSPTDNYEDVDEKVADYFDAGVPLIWVVTPKIMGERTGLHPVTIIVAIFFWGTAFGGVLGMLLAIPLTAFFVTAWRLAKQKYFAAPHG